MRTFDSYVEWRSDAELGAGTPVDYYAERAWNAAVDRMAELVKASYAAEGGDGAKIVMLLTAELEGLKS